MIKKIVGGALLIIVLIFGVDSQMNDYKLSGIAISSGVVRNGQRINPFGVAAKGHQVPILLEHQRTTNDILGHVTKLLRNRSGVYFEAIINCGGHPNVIDKIERGDLAYLSIGFIPLVSALPEGYKGNLFTTPPYFHFQIDLLEISIVPLPMDPRARIIKLERMGLLYKLKKFGEQLLLDLRQWKGNQKA
jgi:phage head maturation protease